MISPGGSGPSLKMIHRRGGGSGEGVACHRGFGHQPHLSPGGVRERVLYHPQAGEDQRVYSGAGSRTGPQGLAIPGQTRAPLQQAQPALSLIL